MYNVRIWCVHVTMVAVEKQYVLHFFEYESIASDMHHVKRMGRIVFTPVTCLSVCTLFFHIIS